MALDSSGYNTSSLFQAKDYDPANTALINSLQSTATYDPTTQSTTSPTSAVRYLGTQNSQNTDAQDTPSTTQNLQSTSGYGNNTNALSAYALQGKTAASQGLTAQSNNSLNSSYQTSQAPGVSRAVTLAPSGSTSAVTSAPTANQATIANSGATTYSGAQVVAVTTASGNLAYYTFNGTTGGYQYVGTYNKNGQAQAVQTAAAKPPPGAKIIADYSGIAGSPVTTPTYAGTMADGTTYTWQDGILTTKASPTALNDAQRSSAQLQTLAGTQVSDGSASNNINRVNANNAQAIAAYQKANTDAYSNAQASQASSSASSLQQAALDYMTTHGGALPPEYTALMNNTYSGNATVQQAQQAALQSAQAAYAAQQAHAATLSGLGLGPIDTSAVDNTNQAAMASLISQYASGGLEGGLGQRNASNQAAALSGQNVLNHEKAAATSYNNNLNNFASALSTQNSYDVSATGNQLYSDIQGVSQIAEALQQEIGQLGSTAKAQAQAQLNNLQNAINNYQAAVREYGQNSANAIATARAIMGGASSLAASVAGA